MRATYVAEAGSKWQIKDIAEPTLGPNQVLIKIKASGLCYTDIHQTEGTLPARFPTVLGHEPVGEIVALGQAVTFRKIGDRVGVPWVQTSCKRCEWCERGKYMFCPNSLGTSQHLYGGHAELMVAHAEATVLLPEAISYEDAAPIFCAGYTVWGGLRLADPKPAEKIAVVGIGGLGHLAIQYSACAGFETIAVSHSQDKEKLARKLGADTVVKDALQLQKLGGADVILFTSNSYKGISELMRSLRPDGRLVLMGLSSEKIELSAPDIMFNRARLIGSIQNGTEYLYEALDLAARGKVKAMIETFPFQDINLAYDKVEAGQVRFRAVITNN